MIPSCSLMGISGGTVVNLTTTTCGKTVKADTAIATYGVNADGTVTKNGAFFENWISNAGPAGNYDVMASLSSGTTPAGTLGSWLALSANQSWSLTNAEQDGSTISCVLTVQIRERASGTVKATATITISATSNALV